MHRFFVKPEDIGEAYITLSPETIKHIQVLRLTADEEIVLCDGLGTDFICTVEAPHAKIIHKIPSEGEAKVACHVYLALSKGERLEWAIQKSVELGAASISLFASQRAIAKFDQKTLPKKCARFTQIALEASKQAGRGIVPTISYFPSLQKAVDTVPKNQVGLFFYELEGENKLSKILAGQKQTEQFHLFIGPEGGFSHEEVEIANKAGFSSVSLGKRILRCETAPVAALAAFMFWANEF